MVTKGIIILNHVKRFFPLCNVNNEYENNKKKHHFSQFQIRRCFFFT